MQVCLNDDDFSGVLGDTLAPMERVRVAVHVAECPTCREDLRRRRAAAVGAGSADLTGPVLTHNDPGSRVAARRVRRRTWMLVTSVGGAVILLGYANLQQWGLLVRLGADLQQARTDLEGARSERAALERAHRLARYDDHMVLARLALEYHQVRRLHDWLEKCPEDLRSWDWRRLSWLADRSRESLRVSVEQVTALACSPDGTRFFAGTADGNVAIYDRENVELATIEAHEGAVLAFAVHPAGELLASAGRDHRVRLWVLPGGLAKPTLPGHAWTCRSLAFSDDGRFLVAASDDTRVRVWNLASGGEPRELRGHGEAVQAVACSPDGRVASGATDGSLLVWQLDSELPEVLGRGGQPVRSITFHPHRDELVVGRDDGTLEVWNLASREIRPVSAGGGAVLAVAVDGDGELLVSGDAAGTLRISEIDSAETLRVLHGHLGPVHQVAFSADGDTVVSASQDGTVRMWDAHESDVMKLGGSGARPDPVLQIGDTGVRLRVLHRERGVAAWPRDGLTPRAEPEPGEPPEGATIVAMDTAGQRVLVATPDGKLAVRELDGGEALVEGPGVLARFHGADHLAWVSAPVQFDGDGNPIDGSAGHRLSVVTLAEDGDPVWRTLAEDLERPTIVEWSPGGTWLAVTGRDPLIRLWGSGSDAELPPLASPAGTPTLLVLSPDERVMLSVVNAGDERRAELRALPEGNVLANLEGIESAVLAAAFTADGKRLATAGTDGVRIWNAVTGRLLMRVGSTESDVTALLFTGDGKLLVAGCEDGSVWVWEGVDP